MQHEAYFLQVNLKPEFTLKDPTLVYLRTFEMNWQQTYRESRFCVRWIRGALVYDDECGDKGSII